MIWPWEMMFPRRRCCLRMDSGQGESGGPKEKTFLKKMCPWGWTMVKEKVGLGRRWSKEKMCP
jgi:hypothetical protein